MMKKNRLILFVFCLLTLLSLSAVCAGEVTPGYLYRSEPDPDFPSNTLYVGWTMDCGGYRIRILQQPVLNKSTNYMVADAETKYLTIRMAITNLGTEPGGWLMPDSFVLQDTYLNRIYGTYRLDVPISAKTAEGFKQDVFYSEIKPGDTLYTSLVFEVYPDVQSWVMTFAPHPFFEEFPEETIRFRLPWAISVEE